MLSNQLLVFNQTQYQRMLYAQLSFLQKLKIKYVAVFNRNLDKFKLSISFLVIFWWKFLIIIIVNSTKIVIVTHDKMLKKCNHLIIFTNEINIDDQIETLTMTMILLMLNMILIVMNKKQIYLKSITKTMIYFEEIVKLNLILNVTKYHFRNRSITIFTNCQIVIQAIQYFKKQSEQYLLQTLIRRLEKCDWEIHIHWIFVHVEVLDNESIDIIAKKITEWR